MSVVPAAIARDLSPTGTLRAAINLGNPVLAGGTPAAPAGVTVDIARELGSRAGVPVELVCVDAARKSLGALTAARADICFLAIDPAREAEIAFTAPYVVIEGVFAVPRDSAITTTADVDRERVRVGVKRGSAYDLFLSPTLQRASVVRADEGTGVLRELGLEAAAGVRQPMAEFVRSHRAIPPDRRPVHADPPGDGHGQDPRPGDHPVPPGLYRGAESQRIRRRRAPARESAERNRRAARVAAGTAGNRQHPDRHYALPSKRPSRRYG